MMTLCTTCKLALISSINSFWGYVFKDNLLNSNLTSFSRVPNKSLSMEENPFYLHLLLKFFNHLNLSSSSSSYSSTTSSSSLILCVMDAWKLFVHEYYFFLFFNFWVERDPYFLLRGWNIRTFQEVTHPTTLLAQIRLTLEL